MTSCKIRCEMPDNEIIELDCEPQNIKDELKKKQNQITYDSIILVDISETVQQVSNALCQTTNNQMKDQMYFKVYDAQQLYKEYKEMEKMKTENEHQIKEIQDKHNNIELQLNQVDIQKNNQDSIIIQLKEENEILFKKNNELHTEVVSITSEKNTVNQVWQTCWNQMSQLMSQLYVSAAQQISKKETDNLKSQLKVEKEKLEKVNYNQFNSENTVQQQNDQIKKYERELKHLKDRISELELNYQTTLSNGQDDEKTTSPNKEQEIKKLQNINKNLIQQVQYLEEEIQQLAKQKSSLEVENKNLNLQITWLTQNIDQLNEEIEEMKKIRIKKISNEDIFKGKLNYNTDQIHEKLTESEQKFQKLEKEMKEKEIQYKNDINSLFETNKSQSADILKTKQAEMEKMKAEKEQQINVIQDKHNKLELDLNQMIHKSNNQDQTITSLEEEIQKSQSKNEELQNEITEINEEKNTLIQQQQQYSNMLNVQNQQLQSYFQQLQQQAFQEKNEFVVKIESLELEITDLEDQLQGSKKETNKLKSLLKQEKEKLETVNDTLSQSETTVQQQNDKIKKYEREVKLNKDKIYELEKSHQMANNNVDEKMNTLSYKDQEIKKLLIANKTQASQIQDQDFQIQQLVNEKINLESKIIGLNQEVQKLKSTIEELNEEIEKLNADLIKKGTDFDRQTRNLQMQKEFVDKELKELKIQFQLLKEQLHEQENRGQNSLKEIQQHKSQIAKLELEVKTITKQNQENQETIRQQMTLISEQKGTISQLEVRLTYAQTQLKQKDDQIKNDQSDFERFKAQMDNINKEMKSEFEQANVKLNIKDHILQKLSKQMQDDKYFDKITGLMDKLMSSPHKIKQFDQDKNVQFEIKEYEIFEISPEYDLAKQLLNNNQFFLFEKCLKKNPKGNVTLNRSVQPNAESTFFKGYLSIVKEATQNEFKGKFFLRKDLISQTQPFTTIDEAIQMSKNNFLCQLLLEQFNKVLKSQKLKEGDYHIARQFVLKLKDKEEYYYSEMVEEGEFNKINGGKFQIKASEADSYFNAFSKFVHAFSKESFIITHLQICGKQVYDMIVSTTYKGLFSSLDQGQTEIEQFLEILNAQTAAGIKLNANLEAIAKEGFK